MASHTSLRQASRVAQSNRSHLAGSRIRQPSQTFNPHVVLSSCTTSFSRSARIKRHYVLQQRRNLSWWGSGPTASPSTSSTPTPDAAPSSNLNVSEPSDIRNIIAPDRSFKASPDISSAELYSQPSTPSPIEPQFVEDLQQAIVKPHFSESDSSSLPTNIEDIPERIGYLKEVCDLDFGWGPTSTVQFVLEHLHIDGGYSWTTSIVLLGIAVRAMLFPALVTAAKETQKMRDMKPILAPIQEEYTAAKAKQDQQKMGVAAQRLMAVRQEFNLKLWKAFLPPMLQIPFGFGCWRLLRNSANVPVPGFVTESWLWTTDLTFSDPYFIAPATSALLIWLTMRSNARVNANVANMGVMSLLQKVLPVATLVFMSFQPGAVQLYFMSSSAVGLLSTTMLQQKPIRAYLNMPPLPDPDSQPAPTPTPSPTGSKTAKSTSSIARATAPPVTGGLHRQSLAARAAEAERAAKAAAEQAERDNRSNIDKAVDTVKGWGTGVKSWTKDAAESTGFAANKEKMIKQNRDSKAEEYEERMRRELDQRRIERNRKNAGRG